MAAPISARPGDLRACGRLVAFVLRPRRGRWLWRVRRACARRPRSSTSTPRNGSAFRPMPKVPTATSTLGAEDPNAQMLVRADEMQYDNTNNRILAVGNVQIYYKRLHARGRPGHLRAEAPSACAPKATSASPRRTARSSRRDHRSDRQFRDGFVDSLQLEAADKTRFAAPRARAHRTAASRRSRAASIRPASRARTIRRSRRAGRSSTTRIIHDETEKMIYFEDAKSRILRLPDAYWPYLLDARPDGQAQDRRAVAAASYTGIQGFGVDGPVLLGPGAELRLHADADADVTPGPAVQGEWRHRLMNGCLFDQGRRHLPVGSRTYSSPDGGTDDPGNRDFRGSFDTTGQFGLNNNWVWGWDGTVVTDKMVLQDYGLKPTSR